MNEKMSRVILFVSFFVSLLSCNFIAEAAPPYPFIFGETEYYEGRDPNESAAARVYENLGISLIKFQTDSDGARKLVRSLNVAGQLQELWAMNSLKASNVEKSLLAWIIVQRLTAVMTSESIKTIGLPLDAQLSAWHFYSSVDGKPLPMDITLAKVKKHETYIVDYYLVPYAVIRNNMIFVPKKYLGITERYKNRSAYVALFRKLHNSTDGQLSKQNDFSIFEYDTAKRQIGKKLL